MIEINLLPDIYRPREKTNVPLMATVAVGMVVVGMVILWGVELKRELGALNSEASKLVKKKKALEDEVEKVNQLKQKIARQKARQTTIIDISQSKVMWSLKLQQLALIMGGFDDFWIKRMQLSKSRKGQALKLDMSAAGGSIASVARFRDALKADPNFAYHFQELENQQVKIATLPEGKWNFDQRMDLTISLPLKTAADGGKKKKRR
jgi:Tfp pilus assembly protein PilN